MAEAGQVRFYFDANLIGVARGFAHLREDVTYPTAPGCPVTEFKAPDEVWVPIVAAEGWAVIMRDKRVRKRPAEWQAFVDAGAVAFVLTGAGQMRKWGIAELLVRHWESMEETLAATERPAMYSVTKKGVDVISLRRPHV